MRKNELDELELHHVPRPHKKQKRHSRGFNEEVADRRPARVSFKNYIRSLEEAENSSLEEGTRQMTAADQAEIVAEFEEWSGGFAPADSEESELRAYAFSSAPIHLDSQEVFDFLKSLSSEGR